MLNTMRSRFIASHTLPLLVIIPLMGVALIYLLESQVLLPSIATETQGEAVLLATIVSDDPGVWSNATSAQAFIRRMQGDLPARIMLLDAQGRLLVSSDPADASRVGQLVAHAGMNEILAGRASVHTDYSQHLDSESADAFIPVLSANHQVLGVLRLTHQLASVLERFLRLRAFIGVVLASALVLGAAVGMILALNLERPLQQLTQSVFSLSSGQELIPLPERGLKEVRVLLGAFNAMTDRLRTLEETRRQLLSNLIHELGTPLGALNSGLQALRGGAADQVELRQELLGGMEDEVHHLRRLLDDLARLYDRVLGAVKLNRQPVELDEWLPRVLTTWREAALAKDLHWKVEIPSDLPVIQVDVDRLAQVVGNLLSNAIKYTPSGGSISVAARRDAQQVCICVSDTGIGIPSDEQELVFNAFYRGRSGGRFAEGMGLGLTIANDLAIAHGGRLEVESAPGRGSRFRLWLPA
jgi:two-component system, OmpR family, sensor histidine kinase BaeS